MIPFNDHKSIKKLTIVLAIGFTVCIVMMILIRKGINYKYPMLKKDVAANGVVKNAKPYQSVVMIELSDGTRFMVTYASNSLLAPPELTQFIQVGDSILKEPGNDTLYIKRGVEKYLFVLDTAIND